MDSSFPFEGIHFGLPIVNIEGSQVIISKQSCFGSLRIVIVFANRVDSDEMPQNAAFHQNLHGLPQYYFGSHQYIKG